MIQHHNSTTCPRSQNKPDLTQAGSSSNNHGMADVVTQISHFRTPKKLCGALALADFYSHVLQCSVISFLKICRFTLLNDFEMEEGFQRV